MVKKNKRTGASARPKTVVDKNQDKRIRKIEKQLAADGHYTTATLSYANVDWDGDYLLINGLQTGDTTNDRTGNRVYLKNLTYNFRIKNPTASVATMRFVLLVHKDPDAAIFVKANVFANQSSNALDVYQMRDLDHYSEFRVLKDTIYTLPPTGQDRPYTQVRASVKLNMQTQYTGTGATISSITKNSLYMIWYSDVDPVAGTKMEVKGGYQLTFNP